MCLSLYIHLRINSKGKKKALLWRWENAMLIMCTLHFRSVGELLLYSTDLDRGFWEMSEEIKILKNLLACSSRENKNNFNIFCLFFNRITSDLVRKNLLLLVMSEEKIKKNSECSWLSGTACSLRKYYLFH